MKKTPITPGKNMINSGSISINTPISSVKRKYMERDPMKAEILEKTKFIKNKIDDIYEKYSKSTDWKEEIIFELKQENIVDISGDLPKSLNTKGSNLLEYTKFWILFIELKNQSQDLELMQTVGMLNNALLYEQNDLGLLQNFMLRFIQDHYEAKEIISTLERLNGGHNHFRVPEKEEDLSTEHYKFLLETPEIFSEAKLNQMYRSNTTPLSSKTKKISHTTGKEKEKGSFLFLSANNNSNNNLFNSTSIWEKKNTTNNNIESESKNVFSAIKSISMFNINNNDNCGKIDENTSQTADFPSQNEISFQSDINITNSKMKVRQSQGVGTDKDSLLKNDNPTLREIIQRNKLFLNIESVTHFEIVKDKNKE